MLANSFLLHDVVIITAVLAATSDFIYVSKVLTRSVFYTTLFLWIISSLLFVFNLYQRLHWYRPAFHFVFGFSVTALLHVDRADSLLVSDWLPIVSGLFLFIAYLLIILNEIVVLSYMGSWFSDICMWLGFCFGSLFYKNPYPLLVCNLLALLYWFLLRQKSVICLFLYLSSISFCISYVIPEFYLKSLNDQKINNHFHFYYAFLFAFYFLYLSLKTFIRGRSQDVSVRCWLLVRSSGYVRYLMLAVFVVTELVYIVRCCIAAHTLSYWRLVFTILLAIFWLLIHFGLWIFLYQLSAKLSECNQSDSLTVNQCAGIMPIWGANGVRAIALTYYPLLLLVNLTTLLCFFCVVYKNDWWTITLFLTCLPVEICLWSFTRELTYVVGGSCVGLKLISTPSSEFSPDQSNLNSTLSNVLEMFFAEFRINVCHTKRAKTHANEVEFTGNHHAQRLRTMHKLSDFFALRIPGTEERFDTYLVYRTGPANLDGDWLMNDGSTIGLNDVVQLWEDSFRNTTDVVTKCRLVLVLDQLYGMKWYHKLLVLPTQSRIALQTVDIESEFRSKRSFVTRFFCGMFLSKDYRSMANRVGDFTLKWVYWNLNNKRLGQSTDLSSVSSDSQRLAEQPPLLARYVVTSKWQNDTCSLSTDLGFLRAVPLVSRWWSMYTIAQKQKEDIYSAITDERSSGFFRRTLFNAWVYYRKFCVYFKQHYLETDHGFLLVDDKL